MREGGQREGGDQVMYQLRTFIRTKKPHSYTYGLCIQVYTHCVLKC